MARWGINATKGAANVQSVFVAQAAAAASRRAKFYDISFGCNAAPADNTFLHVLQRVSASGGLAGAALTPNSLDPADTLASTIVVTATVTVDATITASAFLYSIPLNQRATFRWVAAPYGELIIPATANVGFMAGLSAASTTTFAYGGCYEEY